MSGPFRPPINQGCYEQQAGPPLSIAEGQECSVLPSLRAAYYALLAGNQTAQVRDGDRWQTFARGDATIMQQEIRRLERLCTGRRPYAIRAGGYSPRGGYPGGYYGGY